jgi:cell wall assembly regulator SMI1
MDSFTSDGCGNHICIDLDPTEDGNFGQVIQMWHDSSNRELYASSFKEWINNYLNDLEQGKFVYVKKWGIVGQDSAYNQVENT